MRVTKVTFKKWLTLIDEYDKVDELLLTSTATKEVQQKIQ